jgi:SAM-dependent methyltransferase
MPDLIFEDPRLVSIYDAFDGQRKDLYHYIDLIKGLGAQFVLDIGCGTGCLAGETHLNPLQIRLSRDRYWTYST